MIAGAADDCLGRLPITHRRVVGEPLDVERQKSNGSRYQVLFWRFSAEYNIVDPRYKIGADFDLLFADRRGVSNSNHCAEGVSSNDELRIVQTTRNWANPAGRGYFESRSTEISVSCSSSDRIRCSNVVIQLSSMLDHVLSSLSSSRIMTLTSCRIDRV